MRWLVAALLLAGCTRDVRDESPPPHDLMVEVWDGRTGLALTMNEVVARLAAVDVVLVGEEHGSRDFQDTQREVLRVAHGVGFDQVAVEWITWAERARIAKSTIDTVEKDLDWAHTWGHDFAAYRDIFAWAFAHDVAIVGVNARRELVKALAKGGREAVPPELQAELTPLDTSFAPHREWFESTMAGTHHPMPPDAIDRFYLAQVLWDETMALHIDALAEHGKVVALAGLGHTQRALGIAHRLKHRFLIVRPVADEREARAMVNDVDYPGREADLLWRYPRNTYTASR